METTFPFSVYEMAVLALANYRLALLVAEDAITRPVRRWILMPRGGGRIGRVRRFATSLIGCTQCVGVWAAALLIGVWVAVPHPLTWILVSILSVSGAQVLAYRFAIRSSGMPTDRVDSKDVARHPQSQSREPRRCANCRD